MVSTLYDETEKLRSVFDALDSENTGYISVDRFVEAASEYFCNSDLDPGGHESIAKIIRALDPERKGQIQFTQFCEGIQKFLELTGPATPADIDPSNFDFLPLQTDDGSGLEDNDRTSPTQLPSDCVDGQPSPANFWSPQNSSILTDYHHHHRTPSAGNNQQQSSVDDDRDSGFGKFSDYFESSRYNGPEEQNVEYLSEESSSSDVPDLEISTMTTPRSNRLLKMANGNRRTPSAIASDLYRSSNYTQPIPLDSSCQSSMSDAVYDDIDGNFVELNDKVKLLESRLQELTEDQTRNDQKQDKLKEENAQLIERVHVLEEQLRDVEYKARQQMLEEQKKHRDLMNRCEKDKSREIEILSQSLQHIEQEYTSLKEEAPQLRNENERLRKETSRQQIELEKLQQDLSSVMLEYKTVQEHAQNEQSKATKERSVHAQLVDELSKELDELRSFKAEIQAKSPSTRSKEMTKSHQRLLEEQLSRLKAENSSLREQTEELQAQLLHRHIEEGRQLLLSSTAGSLAAELENITQDEMKEIINKEREANAKLRDYIERITLRILEKNPSILEIGSK